jgi:hypothetical protein
MVMLSRKCSRSFSSCQPPDAMSQALQYSRRNLEPQESKRAGNCKRRKPPYRRPVSNKYLERSFVCQRH